MIRIRSVEMGVATLASWRSVGLVLELLTHHAIRFVGMPEWLAMRRVILET